MSINELMSKMLKEYQAKIDKPRTSYIVQHKVTKSVIYESEFMSVAAFNRELQLNPNDYEIVVGAR